MLDMTSSPRLAGIFFHSACASSRKRRQFMPCAAASGALPASNGSRISTASDFTAFPPQRPPGGRPRGADLFAGRGAARGGVVFGGGVFVLAVGPLHPRPPAHRPTGLLAYRPASS